MRALEALEPAVRVREAEPREAARVLRGDRGLAVVADQQVLDREVMERDRDHRELLRARTADLELARVDEHEHLREALHRLGVALQPREDAARVQVRDRDVRPRAAVVVHFHRAVGVRERRVALAAPVVVVRVRVVREGLELDLARL